MKLSLSYKVTGFIVLLMFVLGMSSAVFFIYAYKDGIRREVLARGITMAESLARSVDEGVASENLDLIGQIQKIGYLNDVVSAQVFSNLWMPMDAYPAKDFSLPPNSDAVGHFEANQDSYYFQETNFFEFYSPVFYHKFDRSKDKKYIIGYVRLKLRSEQAQVSLQKSLAGYLNIILIATVSSILLLTMFIRKIVLKPLLGLQKSAIASAHDNLPLPVPVYSNDEIGDLSRAFNDMCEGLRNREEMLHEQTVQLEEEIGERQMAQEALQEQARILEEEIGERRQAEEKLRIIFDAAQAGITMVDANGVITFANNCVCQLCGCELNEMVGSRYIEHVHPNEHSMADILLQKLIRGDINSISAERHYLRKNGDDFWAVINAKRQLDDCGSLISVIIVITDITELCNAQTLMTLNFHRLASLVKILQYKCDSIQELLDYALAEAIKLTESKFGYIYFYDETHHEFILNSWSSDVMEECAVAEQQTRYALEKTGLWGEAVRQRQPILENNYNSQNPLKKGYPDGHVHLERFLTIPVFSENMVVAVVGVANKAEDFDQTDVLHLTMLMDSVWKICEQKKAEQERDALQQKFNQSQKMEAIGRLAGGVAHDFNNKLSVIMGYAELLRMQAGKLDEEQCGRLDQILKAANHSREITRQLLAFSRSEVISPHEVDINSIIEDSRNSLGRLIGEDIKLDFKPASKLWATLLDPTQVDQIIMNLAVNARDAMPNGGLLAIETANVHIDESYVHENPDAHVGDYVQVIFSDDGCGMDSATYAHIFEPFFTTKTADKGTGLGLATIYGIVSQNKGFITVYSEVNLGTTFKIHFPRMLSKNKFSSNNDFEETVLYGSGTILLVEDEESLKNMASDMLVELGYDVIEAKTPAEAIKWCESGECKQIDLILTDVVMPEMNGKEMCDRILAIRPNTPILFMSGFTADIMASKGILEESVLFLQKPFNLLGLSLMIRKAIDHSRAI